MIKQLEQVNQFMKVMGQEMPDYPAIPSSKIVNLRQDLVLEEVHELVTAAGNKDIVEVADALCDLLYVTLGAFTAYGFKPELVEELFDEVQRSNMSKLCQTQQEASDTMFYYVKLTPSILTQAHEQPDGRWVVSRASDGKVLKSINWSEPDLRSILLKHVVQC